jgi:hypothetical protein
MRELKAATSWSEMEGDGEGWEKGGPEAPPGEKGMRGGQCSRSRWRAVADCFTFDLLRRHCYFYVLLFSFPFSLTF